MPVSLEKNYSIGIPANLSSESSDNFELEIESCIANSPLYLLLDCSLLKHASSAHVALLWLAHQKCQEKGTQIYLKAAPTGLIRVLEVLNLDEFFPPADEVKPFSQGPINQNNPGKDRNSYWASFKAEALSIKQALNRFGTFLADAKVPEITQFELCTVFYEVAMNIESHSKVENQSEIAFSAAISNCQIIMKFSDKGIPFDPTDIKETNKPLSAAKQKNTRGYGLYLINRLVHSSSYSREADGTNLLILEKRWSA